MKTPTQALAMLAVLACSVAVAAEPQPAPQAAPATPAASPTAPAGGGEVDISDVQNQYWRAHDKDFEVVQNKQYTKAGRFELTPEFGVYQSGGFDSTETVGAAVAYHLTDTWGFELSGYKMFTSDSYELTQFKQQTGATIDFNIEHYYIGGQVLFAPIYGKFSLLGKKISHFETYLAPGMGAIKTTALRAAPSLAVGEKFWISSNFNIRVEYRIMWYSDTITATSGTFATKNGGPGSFTNSVTDQNLIFGISYLF